MSIRNGVIEPQSHRTDSLLVEVTARSGEKFYFSDLLNWILFENMSEPPYSIWAYLCARVPEDVLPRMPDLADIVRYAARTVGTRRFGVPRLPPEHMPKIMPRAALDAQWRMVREELIASARSPRSGLTTLLLQRNGRWRPAAARFRCCSPRRSSWKQPSLCRRSIRAPSWGHDSDHAASESSHLELIQ